MKRFTGIVLAIVITILVYMNAPAQSGGLSTMGGLFIIASSWALALGIFFDSN
jgi:hypothetical protein